MGGQGGMGRGLAGTSWWAFRGKSPGNGWGRKRGREGWIMPWWKEAFHVRKGATASRGYACILAPQLPVPCLPGPTRFAMSEEDFEISIKAYEWPRKMTDIMKEATTKVTGGRQGAGRGCGTGGEAQLRQAVEGSNQDSALMRGLEGLAHGPLIRGVAAWGGMWPCKLKGVGGVEPSDCLFPLPPCLLPSPPLPGQHGAQGVRG